MAQTLGYSIDRFGEDALDAQKEIQVSSMCTVFAESEVTSLLAKGENRCDIALALHRLVVPRAAGMLKRVTITDAVLFAGGVALNPCMVQILQEVTDRKMVVPENPQMLGALGAALIASEQWNHRDVCVPYPR